MLALWALALVGVIAVVAVALQHASSSAEGPRPIAWGEEACAHCRMLISDPRYAAQIVTRDGAAASFDDPGCLFAALATFAEPPLATYFRHGSEDRWLAEHEVAFVRGGPTPMGFDLVAVDVGTPGSLTLAEAARRLGERRGPHAHDGIGHTSSALARDAGGGR